MKPASFRRPRIFLALNAAFAAALVLAPPARADEILYGDDPDTRAPLQSAPDWTTFSNRTDYLFPGTTSAPLFSGNTVTVDYVTGGGITGPYHVFGGLSNTDPVTGNKVFIKKGSVEQHVFGGYARSTSNDATASGNTVTISGGSVGKNIVGGYGIAWSSFDDATASGNTVTISGGSVEQDVFGGYALSASNNATASGNTVTISGGSVGKNIVGGYGNAWSASGDATASGNTVTISGGSVGKNIVGGHSWVANYATGEATGNTVTLSGSPTLGATATVYGGFVGDYYDDEFTDPLSGADAFTGNKLEKKSDVTVFRAQNFATVEFDYSGDANIATLDTSPGGSALTAVTLDTKGNNIAFGGVIEGDGGVTKTGGGTLTLAKANTHTGGTTINTGILELAASGSLQSDVAVKNGATLALRGAVNNSGDVDIESGGILNAHQGGTITGDLTANAATLNFYLPQGIDNGETILNVNGNVTLSGNNTVSLYLDGSYTSLTALATGKIIKLIDASGSLTNSGTVSATAHIGATLTYQYDFDIAANETDDELQAALRSVTPPVTPPPPDDPPVNPPVNPSNPVDVRAKSLSEGFLAGTAFLNQGADFLADRGLSAALQNGAQSKRQSFAAIGGSRVKHETGSHVDVEGYSLVAGLAVTRPLPAGEVTVGAFIEHGEGDYDTSNSFSNAASVHGKGEANYTGGGVLAHLTFGENARGDAFYTEASAHAGKVKLDFATRDLLDAFGRRAAYDSDSSYASAHAGLGYIWNVSDSDRVKLYSQYLWSRQGSDTVKLTTGEPVKFADVDSHRTRLGARWSHRLNQNGQAYLGAAWEREYDGKARASIHGYSLRTPDLKGNTGLVEAGFAFTPSANQPLTLDIGVQGYAGKREGVTGSFRLNYRF